MEKSFLTETPKSGIQIGFDQQKEDRSKDLQLEMELLSIQIAALNKRVAQLKKVFDSELNVQNHASLMQIYDEDFILS